VAKKAFTVANFAKDMNSLLVHGTRVICGSTTGQLVIYDAEARSVLIRLDLGSPVVSLAVAKGIIYAATLGKGIFRVPDDGEFRPNEVLRDKQTIQVALHGEVLYYQTKGGTVCRLDKDTSEVVTEGSNNNYADGYYSEKFQLSDSQLFHVAPGGSSVATTLII
jgi:hypothetical protein